LRGAGAGGDRESTIRVIARTGQKNQTKKRSLDTLKTRGRPKDKKELATQQGGAVFHIKNLQGHNTKTQTRGRQNVFGKKKADKGTWVAVSLKKSQPKRFFGRGGGGGGSF